MISTAHLQHTYNFLVTVNCPLMLAILAPDWYMYLATLPILSLGLYPLPAESRFCIYTYISSGIKCNDKVRDHEKLMHYMCLNKPAGTNHESEKIDYK